MFWTLYRQLILRNLRKNILRSVLTVIGIALGVAIFLAIHIANQTAVDQFKSGIDAVSGKANLEIRPVISQGFDEKLAGNLSWIWDEGSHFTPLLEKTAIWSGKAGEVINVLGVDMLADESFRTPGKSSETSNKIADFSIFNRHTALITPILAQYHHLKKGDIFTLLVNDRQEPITVAGIIDNAQLSQAYGGNILLMDISGAQDLFQSEHALSAIQIIVPEEKLATVQQRLNKQLNGYLQVARPERRGQQVERMLEAFQYNLDALSFIALLVGMFLIYNTMSIAVIRRRPEIGALRTIGVSRHFILCLFSMEALLLGVTGSFLGVVLGIALSYGTTHAISSTVQTLYTGQPITTLTLNPILMLEAFALGVLLTLLSALWPSLEAASVAPAYATRPASYESKTQRYSKPLGLVGILSGLLALGCAFLPAVNHFPLFGYVSTILAILSATLFLPGLLSAGLKPLGRMLTPLLGPEVTLATQQLTGSLGRISVAVASLMIGIAMMVSLAMMIGGFRETVIVWVNQTLKADLWIEPSAHVISKNIGPIQPGVIKAIGKVPGIEAVDSYIEFPMTFRGNPAYLGTGDFNILARYGTLSFTNGEKAERVFQRMNTTPSVLVTESFAEKNQVHVGDRFNLESPSGPFKVTVQGIYYDYASEQGYIILPRDLYRRYFHDDSATNLAIYLKPNVSAEVVRQTILKTLNPNVHLLVRTNNALRQEVLRIFDSTFAMTYAMHFISIFVALLSIINTLFALVLESKRDFGILKYLGAQKSQIIKIVLIEAGILGFIGNILGLVLGWILSLVLITVINKQSFGWSIRFAWPVAFLIQSFIAVMLTSLLAGILPARMAAKTVAPEVLRSE